VFNSWPVYRYAINVRLMIAVDTTVFTNSSVNCVFVMLQIEYFFSKYVHIYLKVDH
jgi:hypothetical protein